ncbi:hypothetical protein [Actinomycetospora aeridis]|uniref:O-antigen/teichoic acid export membrane protein n=1 Tax=Actinomycetospora aeridis TaxID=3129231 RepID=A0ABU8N8J0_9PSEU
MRLSQALKKLSGFTLAPVVASVAPLFAIPVISSHFGAEGWTSVAVGQSIGTAFAVAIDGGWSLIGPPRVARGSADERSAIYRQSLLVRLWLMVGAAPLIALSTLVAAPGYTGAAITSAFAASMIGLSANWFFVGASQPAKLLLFDAAPKILLVLVGIFLLLVGLPLIYFSLAVFVGGLGAAAVSYSVVRPTTSTNQRYDSLKATLAHLRENKHALATRVYSAMYVSAPLPIVATLLPLAESATFAGADRIQKYALLALMPITQLFQGWVPRAVDGTNILRRFKTALAVHVAISLTSIIGLVLATPLFEVLLFRDTLALSTTASLASGFVILAVVVSRATSSLLLVQARMTAVTANSTLIGAACGICALVGVCLLQGSAVTALWIVAASEILVTTWQLISLPRAGREIRELFPEPSSVSARPASKQCRNTDSRSAQ